MIRFILTHSRLDVRLAALVLVGGVAGCGSEPTNENMKDARLHLSFSAAGLSPEDVALVRKALANAQQVGGVAQGEKDQGDLEFDVPIAKELKPDFSYDEFAEVIRKYHKIVCGIRTSQGAQIPFNNSAHIRLHYQTTTAEADVTLKMRLRVDPPGSALRIDADIPELENPLVRDPATKAIKLTNETTFEIAISQDSYEANEYLYFTTTYGAATRYFEYHLRGKDSHRQREVTGIGTRKGSDLDWKFYKEHRTLPPP